MIARVAAAAVVLCLATACASSGPGSRQTQHGDANRITHEQLVSTGASDAYEAIRQLRPSFLRPHGNATIRDPHGVLPVIYVDDARLGGIENLRDIAIVHVQEIRYIDAIEATTRFGQGHTGGAILVITRSQQ